MTIQAKISEKRSINLCTLEGGVPPLKIRPAAAWSWRLSVENPPARNSVPRRRKGGDNSGRMGLIGSVYLLQSLDFGATQSYHKDKKEDDVTVKSSISLTDEQDEFARSLVKSGRYSSVSAVVQQSLELLKSKIDGDELEVQALKELLSQRREGKFVSSVEMKDRVSKLIQQKRRSHGI